MASGETAWQKKLLAGAIRIFGVFRVIKIETKPAIDQEDAPRSMRTQLANLVLSHGISTASHGFVRADF